LTDSIATLPRLTPLEHSHTDNDIEAGLNRLFIDLFNTLLAEKVLDANSLGMMQMGTAELLKRAIAVNGLVMVNGVNEEDISRHLYKAWMAQNQGGRGFHFLEFYLQLVYPNAWRVEWLSQLISGTYPNQLVETDGTDPLYFQTSRINIKVDASTAQGTLPVHMKTIMSILPARFVPRFIQIASRDVKLRVGAVANISETLFIAATVAILPEIKEAMTLVGSNGNISETIHIKATVRR
jgi:hypothetical protein